MISAVCGGNLANCGIALYNSAGAQIIGCDIISSVMSVATFLGPEQGVVNMSCNELLCDGLRDRGDLLGSRGGVVASFHSRSGEVSGLVINGGSRPIIIDTLSLTNCHFLTNWYDGVEILCNAKNIAFIGCQFSGNGFGSPGNYNGLLAYGSAGIGGLSIIGDRANGGLWEGWPIVQGNGVNLGGRISPLTIQGVHTIGNSTRLIIPPRVRQPVFRETGRRHGDRPAYRVRIPVPLSAPTPITQQLNSGRARCPSKDSRASSRADSWGGTPGRSPEAYRWSAGPGGGAGTFHSRAAAGCPSTNCRWRKR